MILCTQHIFSLFKKGWRNDLDALFLLVMVVVCFDNWAINVYDGWMIWYEMCMPSYRVFGEKNQKKGGGIRAKKKRKKREKFKRDGMFVMIWYGYYLWFWVSTLIYIPFAGRRKNILKSRTKNHAGINKKKRKGLKKQKKIFLEKVSQKKKRKTEKETKKSIWATNRVLRISASISSEWWAKKKQICLLSFYIFFGRLSIYHVV